MTGALRRATLCAARAVWDFLVGDTPEVLVIVLVVAAVACAVAGRGAIGVVALPLLAIGGLGLSVWRGCRGAR